MPVKVKRNNNGFGAETKTDLQNKNLIDFFALLYKVDKRVNPKLYIDLKDQNVLRQSFVTGSSVSSPEK